MRRLHHSCDRVLSMARCGLLPGLLAVSLVLGFAPRGDTATPTVILTLNQTEFRAGETLTVGLQMVNPSDGPLADVYIGVMMPDGLTALFLIPEGITPPVSLADSAHFRPLQTAAPGFTLNAPVFLQFTWPGDGTPIGTYLLFAALVPHEADGGLGLDIKAFTYSPRNVFLPMFRTPFDGDFALGNWFDHDLPFEFTDTNGFLLTFAGEQTNGIDGHSGYDFGMPEGTPLLAVADGNVIFAGQGQPFACPTLNNQLVSALAVTVRHGAPNGESIDSSYLHLSRVDVQGGQQVVAGQQLGLSGNTGCSTAPHLHFAVYRVTHTNSGRRAVIDPFGWDAPQPDPWAQHPQGAQSLYLWLPGQAPALHGGRSLAPNCGTPTCGNAAVAITRWSVMGVRDDLNPNNEFVELTLDPRFASGGARDLTGYTLRNRQGDTYAFPAGVVIHDGQPLRVFTGPGVNGTTVQFWGLNHGVWDNFAECIQLVSPSGGRYRITTATGACN